MKFYLAARYSRREEICGYRTLLELNGHEVTSRWLNGTHQAENDQLGSEVATRFAHEDLEDLAEAQVLVAFTEEPRASSSRGGRHTEFGWALACGQGTVVVGPVENVFYQLAGYQFVSFDRFETALSLHELTFAGLCHVCGCTDDMACDGGCEWADEDQSLCSSCSPCELCEAERAEASA